MTTIIKCKHLNDLQLPKQFADDDIRFSEELVSYFLERFTVTGDIVFDPFAGFGTTLFVCEKMNRVGYGIEYIEDRVNYIKSIIHNKDNIVCGNSLNLLQYDIPMIDFTITSPPYMSKNNHEQYPFAGYEVTGADYSKYLIDIQHIYKQLKNFLKPNAYAVIEVSNIINQGILTTLAWDVAKSVGKVLTLEKEIVVDWKSDKNTENCAYGFGYDHSYCLIFRNN